MDEHSSHATYDELPDTHEMACDCACACDNLNVEAGTAEHAAHLRTCDTSRACSLHVPDSAAKQGADIHLHLH